MSPSQLNHFWWFFLGSNWVFFFFYFWFPAFNAPVQLIKGYFLTSVVFSFYAVYMLDAKYQKSERCLM